MTLAERKHAWYIANRERLAMKRRAVYEADSERYRAAARKWHAENGADEGHRAAKREYAKLYRLAHPDRVKECLRQHHIKNRAARRAQSRAYHEQHRDEMLLKAKGRHLANPERDRERSKRWHGENRVKSIAKSKTWRAEHPEQDLASRLKPYGLTLAEYRAMLSGQGGVCAICKRPNESKRTKRLTVDHDHGTGKVRGLLCGACNKAIGLMRDNPEILENAAEYLRPVLLRAVGANT